MARHAQINWKSFLNYRTEVGEFGNEYRARRRAFLEKELSPEKAEKYKSVVGEGRTGEEKGNPKMSVIVELGIDTSDGREMAWIERYSKWQAYINKQFTLSFERLVDNDC